MFKNLSIKAKLQVMAFLSVLLVSIIVAMTSIYAINDLSTKNIESFKKEAYAKKEKELKNYVSLAIKTIDTYYKRTAKDKVKQEVQGYLKEQSNFLFSILEGEYERLQGQVSEDKIKSILRAIVKKTRYGKTGYFWINDTDAVIVMHPFKPQLDGKNLYSYKDKGGKQIFKEFALVAKNNEEGYVDYVWPKPGFEKPQPKVSFVKLFKPFNWVIGTGEYVDNVTEKLKEDALMAISQSRYGKDGYFWINDSHPKMVMHPIKPSLDGKDLSAIKDKAGKLLFMEMSKVANKNSEGGLVKYMWPKPGFDKPQQKFSYVQRFEAWDWIVGTGAYVNDIEQEIAMMQKDTQDEIQTVMTMILVIALVSIVIVGLISSILVKKGIIQPIEELKNTVTYLINNNKDRREKIRKQANDEIGALVDAFNDYLGKLQDIAKEDEEVIEEVEKVINRVNNGFYVYKVQSDSTNPQVQKLKSSINSMIDQTNIKLEEINKTLLEYGSSKFDYQQSNEGTSSNGIIGSILSSTAILGGTVSEILALITSSGNKLNENANVLSGSVDKLAKSANEQAASLEETAAAVEEITALTKNSAEKVHQMSVLANDLNTSASQGESLASRTTSAMEEIDTQVGSINEAITVIDQIAFQTNILSLNAAVEAATAGEAGKGFAVVAQEVRNLASRSAEAAKEIKDLVEQATTKANEGKSIADEMIGGYGDLNAKVAQTITLINEVTSASKEQESGIVQINDTINTLDRSTQINASSASEINTLSDEVLELSNDLLSIAKRASYDKSKAQQICDVDLVFKTAKLKNDHIIFKNNNFGKVGSSGNTTWAVTKETECDLGNWILEQERNNESFSKTNNWKVLKENHVQVHQLVQTYIDENAKEEPEENLLLKISKEVETATFEVFKCLDVLKVEHCKVHGNQIATSVPTKTFETPKTSEVNESSIKKEQVGKIEVAPSSAPVISPKNEDEDEWESF